MDTSLGVKFLDVCYTNGNLIIALYNLVLLALSVGFLSTSIQSHVRFLFTIIYFLIILQMYVPIGFNVNGLYNEDDLLKLRIGLYIITGISAISSFILAKYVFVYDPIPSSLIGINMLVFLTPLIVTSVFHGIDNSKKMR
jgi:hypothetical protein